MDRICYLNGSYVKEAEAKIPISDLGVLRGYGIFDYLRTYLGKPFHLGDHLLRLKYSADQIGLDVPESLEKIEEIISKLLQENHSPESSIKIVVTGGFSSDHMMPENQPTLLILAYPFKPFPKHLYENGIQVITSELLRLTPSAKTTHYTSAIMSLRKAHKKGAYDALYLNRNQEILEATTSNFFAFKDGVLITPASEEILFGITREIVLKIAPFKIETRPIHYNEIGSLDEAFVCSTNREIMPISQIDGASLKLGENTRALMEVFQDYICSGKWDPLVIERYRAPASPQPCPPACAE